ncbi:hypothetical protein TNCV_2323661 [Trichonephila clavipes]|nr:hypothetical protein TNCV_2323661 [Trichonephila clavipes]
MGDLNNGEPKVGVTGGVIFLHVDAFSMERSTKQSGRLVIQFIEYHKTPRHINYDEHGRHNKDKETTTHSTNQPAT